MLIAIIGENCSGKSTLAKALAVHFSSEVVSGKVLTVPPNHVDALAYAMERALQDDFQIVPEKHFPVSANLEQHIALYNSILTPP